MVNHSRMQDDASRLRNKVLMLTSLVPIVNVGDDLRPTTWDSRCRLVHARDCRDAD